jgi:hypothetical protein
VAYSPEFEAAWAAYPKRAGGNPKKRAFAKYQSALQAEGVTEAELLRSTENYDAYCDSEKKAGTQYVLQTQTFFTDERWRDFLQPVSANGRQAIGNLQEVAW